MVWSHGVHACRKRSWAGFRKYLCALLEACLERDSRYLVVNRSGPVRYVQFQSPGGGDLLGEAVSNDYLTGDELMSAATLRRLRSLGWRKPSAGRRQNFTCRWAAPVDLCRAADLAVATLAQAYQIASPSRLEITLGSFETAGDPNSTVTMVSRLPALQLASGLVVHNAFSGSRYRVGAPLGAGGFGSVYRVAAVAGPRIPTACVLKVTLEPTGWHREAYFGDLLKDEPAVVRMYESFAWIPPGSSQPLYCLVLELMDGGDIQHYLQKRPEPWKESKARYEVARILRAVKLLHQGGAVHRDLTPRNIFVTAERRLKIGDFGIALHGVSGKGVTADTFNPGYAPPKLLKHWSPADDVFHIGKLLAMLLSGGASFKPTRKEVKSLPCSAAAKAIIQRCLGEKRKRFRDADELLAALEDRIPTPQTIRVSSLAGKHVVFTGEMAMVRAEARRLVENCGGVCQSSVSGTTDVVVVGDGGAPDWIAEHKGNKLLDVDREWSRGHRIAIVREARFLKLVGR